MNNWVQAGLSVDNVRQVSAVGGNSISVSGGNLTVSENDRIFVIGNTEPTVVGGSATYTTPDTIIRERDDDGAGLIVNSMVTTNSDGLVEFYSNPALYDCIIQDGNQSNQGSVVDLPIGISTDYPAVFGATVTITVFGVTFSDSNLEMSAHPTDVFDVKWYGAQGDGSTNDQVAVQTAINAAETNNGGKVYFLKGTYNVTNLMVETARITLTGEGRGLVTIQGTGSTGHVITATKNHIKIEELVVGADATRAAVAGTSYVDPTAGNNVNGKHGIAFIPSDNSTTQGWGVVRNVIVQDQPDDGLLAEQPELMIVEGVISTDNGRFGIHLNGQANDRGIANHLVNVRGITCGSYGIFIRNIGWNTLINPEALNCGGGIHIYIHGGVGNVLINADVENGTYDTGAGVTFVGSKHQLISGTIQGFKTPIDLNTAVACTVNLPHITNSTAGTSADVVVSLDSASNNNNLILGPLDGHTLVTDLYSISVSARGNHVMMDRDIINFDASDATPDVRGGHVFGTTDTTTITNFANGYPGQRLTVLFQAATVIDFTGTSLHGNAGVNFTATANDTMTCWTPDAAEWYCDVSDNTS